jgi:hypothetical protein
LFAAMTVVPSNARKSSINAVIAKLINDGIWDKLDLLYVMAAHDSQAARLSWKAPGADTLSPVGSPTFTTDSGYAGNGSSMYLDSGRAMTSFSQYQQNSAHLGCWTTVLGSGFADIGANGGAVDFNPHIANSSGSAPSGRINDTTAITGSGLAATGHWVMNRSASNARQLYNNASSRGSDTQASTGVNAGTLTPLRSNTVFANCRIAIAHVGASLNSTEVTNLYNALNTYMTG